MYGIPQRMMKNTLHQVVSFVDVQDILPESFNGSFWNAISDNAPFSWGDNNLSLVTACDFKDHVLRCLDPDTAEKDGEMLLFDGLENPVPKKDFDSFISDLDELGTGYVNLETAGADKAATAVRCAHADLVGTLAEIKEGDSVDVESIQISVNLLEEEFAFLEPWAMDKED